LQALLDIRDANFSLSSDQRESIALFASELAIQDKSLIGSLAKILESGSEQSSSKPLDKSQTRWPGLE
jgi:hypothetical protein